MLTDCYKYVTVESHSAGKEGDPARLLAGGNMKLETDVESLTTRQWKAPTVMATVGPTLEQPEHLEQAIKAGARWFRLPCGYRQRAHVENARAVRQAAAQLEIPVQLLLDLPSSRPRTGNMEELRVAAGDRVVFCGSGGIRQRPKPAAEHSGALAGLGGTAETTQAAGTGYGFATGASALSSRRPGKPRSSRGWKKGIFHSSRRTRFFCPTLPARLPL